MPVQRTLALIKPDATARPWLETLEAKVPPPEDAEGDVPDTFEPNAEMRASDKATAIIERVKKAGFTIVEQRMLHLSKAEAEQFYAEHAGKPFFEKLTSFMSSGPITAMVLEKEDGIKAWRALMGPTNALKAKEEAERDHPLDEDLWSLRAVYGTDGTRNATHGSDSIYSAEREISFFFPSVEKYEQSVLLVLPHAVAAGQEAEVTAALEKADFYVTVRTAVELDAEFAAKVAADAAPGDEAAAAALVAALTAPGGCVALAVDRIGAVPRLRSLCGPPPSVAKGSAPASLHARLGVDDAAMGVLAASSSEAVAALYAPKLFPVPAPMQTTLAVVEPAFAAVYGPALLREVRNAGFTVLGEAKKTFSPDEAAAAVEAAGLATDAAAAAALATRLTQGPVFALALTRANAIASLQQLLGPADPATAALDRPTCLRTRLPGPAGAAFPVLHCSPAAPAAVAGLRLFFPFLAVDPASTAAAAAAYIKTTAVAAVWDIPRGAKVPKTIESAVVDGLAALAKAKPSIEPSEALRWLGQWYLENNPRYGKARARETPVAAPAAAARGMVVREPEDDEAAPAAPVAGGAASPGPRVELLPSPSAAPKAAGGAAAAVRSARAAAAAAAAAAGEGGAASTGRDAFKRLGFGSHPLPSPSAAAGTKPTIVFVLGAPGSGKGTQCAKIADTFGYTHLSTGDLLRAECAAQTELGKQVSSVMASGGLVGDDIVLQLLRQAMAAASAAGKGHKFLIDGYPRSLGQAVDFERVIGQPTLVLAFSASEAVLEERLLARGLSSGRADDTTEAIRKRFKAFVDQSAPVIDFYGKLGIVKSINSERSVDAVFADVVPCFRPEMVWVVGGPGSGRSALAKALASDPKLGSYRHLSVHELLVAELVRAPSSEDAFAIDRCIRRGDPVPTPIVMRLLTAAVDATEPLGRFLLDGAPLDAEQATALEAAFGAPRFILQLEAPDAVLTARSASRRAETGRPEDHKAVVAVRLGNYKSKTLPAMVPYEKCQLVRKLDARAPLAAVTAAAAAAFAPAIVFVLGGPGAGKGTQCERIVADFGYTHLSAGDLLRAEVTRGSPAGAAITACIAEGKLVPVETTLALLRQAMSNSRSRAFLIDGFPRDVAQALDFEASVGTPAFVLYFECPEAVMKARLLERGKTSCRADDNEATITKRFKTFMEASLPVMHHYAASGKVRTINATLPVDEVYAHVKALFGRKVGSVIGGPCSGRSTQTKRLAAEYGYVPLDVATVMEGEVARGTAVGKAYTAALEAKAAAAAAAALAAAAPAGEAAPAPAADAAADPVPALAVSALVAAMAASAPATRFLVDGFPSTLEEVQAAEAAGTGLFGNAPAVPAVVVNLEISKEAAKARYTKRAIAAAKAAALAKGAKPAEDGEELPGVPTPEALEKAFEPVWGAYAEAAKPVLGHYRRAGVLRSVAAAAAGGAEAVFHSCRQAFQPAIITLVGTAGSGRDELAKAAGLALGYHTIKVGALLRAEVAAGGRHAAAIASAFENKETVPVDVAVDLIQRAVLASPSSRFLLEGWPRVVSTGVPMVHDQVFALEAKVGPVKGCIVLATEHEVRARRCGATTAGQLEALRARLDAYTFSKAPVGTFFSKLGKALVIDTSKDAPDEVYEAARPFLE